MDTSSNLTNLILLTAISSTTLSLDYGIDDFSIAPTENIEYSVNNKSVWQYSSVSHDYNYSSVDEDKINIIVDFAKELVSNSENLNSEFSDIVNDNFFDLL